MPYPSLEEIINLHKKLAVSDQVFHKVFTHCEIVYKIALQIKVRKKLKVNNELLTSGSLLHDIGAYDFFNAKPFNEKEYIRHGIQGYYILKKHGFPEDLCRIASHHTGLGLRKSYIIKMNLPLPHNDYLAETLEERLIMYADKFHSKHPRFNKFESYMSQASRFGNYNITFFQKFADEFGVPSLGSLAEEYKMPLI